jgi:hypothetical protein
MNRPTYVEISSTTQKTKNIPIAIKPKSEEKNGFSVLSMAFEISFGNKKGIARQPVQQIGQVQMIGKLKTYMLLYSWSCNHHT